MTLKITNDFLEVLSAMRDGREIEVRCTDEDCESVDRGVPENLKLVGGVEMSVDIGRTVFWSGKTVVVQRPSKLPWGNNLGWGDQPMMRLLRPTSTPKFGDPTNQDQIEDMIDLKPDSDQPYDARPGYEDYAPAMLTSIGTSTLHEDAIPMKCLWMTLRGVTWRTKPFDDVGSRLVVLWQLGDKTVSGADLGSIVVQWPEEFEFSGEATVIPIKVLYHSERMLTPVKPVV